MPEVPLSWDKVAVALGETKNRGANGGNGGGTGSSEGRNGDSVMPKTGDGQVVSSTSSKMGVAKSGTKGNTNSTTTDCNGDSYSIAPGTNKAAPDKAPAT